MMMTAPWLESLAGHISKWSDEGGAVLACSALKESYRNTLVSKWGGVINWIFLTGPKPLLSQRIEARKGHFFDTALLCSQLNTLELPNYGLQIDIKPSPDDIVNVIRADLSKS